MRYLLMVAGIVTVCSAPGAALASGYWGRSCPPLEGRPARQWCEKQDNGSHYCTCQPYGR